MAEIIHLREIQRARRRGSRARREELGRAVAVMKDNLAWAAEALREAPPAEQAALLDRIEKLSALIRYGLLMLGEIQPEPGDELSKLRD